MQIAKANQLISRRAFATAKAPSPPPASTKPAQYIPPTPKELATKERDHWIQLHTNMESDPGTKGPHFIGGKRNPFPLNPLYVPVSPLSSTTKAAIAEMHETESSFAVIAKSFGISIARVHGLLFNCFWLIEAVIKLSNIGKEWMKNGIPMQTDLATNMDRLLGAQTRVMDCRDIPMEKTRPLTSQRVIFHLIASFKS